MFLFLVRKLINILQWKDAFKVQCNVFCKRVRHLKVHTNTLCSVKLKYRVIFYKSSFPIEICVRFQMSQTLHSVSWRTSSVPSSDGLQFWGFKDEDICFLLDCIFTSNTNKCPKRIIKPILWILQYSFLQFLTASPFKKESGKISHLQLPFF